MTLRLVTHCTQAYLPRMRPYLDSLAAGWPGLVTLLTVEFDAPAEFRAEYPWLVCTPAPLAPGAPEGTHSLQHGAFIDLVPGAADDVLIYTDGDLVLQHVPAPAELRRFAALPAGAVAACWNSGPGETLAVEAGRLWPRSDPALTFGDMVYHTPCYNIGVIAAQRQTWAALWARYMTRWDDALAVFGAQQRQQWLVCWALADLGLAVHVLGYEVVLNGHYPLPAGAAVGAQGATYHGEPVLFRHKL